MAIFLQKETEYWPSYRGEHPLDVVLTPGLGGAWSEFRGERELIRFGFPEDARNRWLKALEPPPGGNHNCASLALERMLFARSIKCLVVADPELKPLVERATRQVKPDVIRYCAKRKEFGPDLFP